MDLRPPILPLMTLRELQDEVVIWADSISPSRRPENTMVKFNSEASELLDAIVNRLGHEAVESELGDCIILLLDLAKMYGVDLIEAGRKKMVINRQRHWRSEDGVIRRNKGGINGVEP